MIALDPHFSVRKIQVQKCIRRETARRVSKSNKFYSYYITLIQKLLPPGFQRRLQSSFWAEEMIENNPNFFKDVLFSDEATFHNSGQLNQDNSYY